MEVKIKGGLFNIEQKSLIKDFVNWSSNKLLGPRITKNIHLTIKTTGPCLYTAYNLYAITEIHEDDLRRYPRSFLITMTSKFSTIRSLVILSHEMVHVKQYARGELKDWRSSSTLSKWQGTFVDESKVSYWDLPWEIDAHGREKGLVAQWAEARGHVGKSRWYREIF